MAKFLVGLFFGICIGGFTIAMNRDLSNDIKCGSLNVFKAPDPDRCSNY